MRALAFFSAAAALACLLALALPTGLVWLLGALLLCFFFLLRRLLPGLRPLRLVALGLGVGFLWFSVYSALFYAPALALENRTIRLEAEVTGWPTVNDHGISVPIRGGDAGSGQRISMLLYLDTRFSSLHPGDRISAVAHLTGTNQIHGQKVLSFRSSGVYLFAKTYGAVTVTPHKGIPLKYYPAYLAQWVRDTVNDLYPKDSAAYLSAMLTGWKGDLRDIDQNALQRTGLSHVVVVSGMHISFLAGAMLLLLGRNKRHTAIIQILVIVFFTAMTGSAPGTVRSAILCSAGLVAPLIGRRTDSVTSLFGALFLLLLANPFSIANAGLQFSFVSTLGIYLVAQPLYAHWEAQLRKTRLFLRLPASVLGTTLGAIIFTIPLGALYFSQVSLIAPVTNLLTHWAVSLSFFGGIVSVLFGAIWLPLGSILALVVELPIAFFYFCARAFSSLPFAAVTLDSVYYQAFLVFLYAVLLVYTFWWRRGSRRLLVPLCACTCTLCLTLMLTGFSAAAPALTLAALDVGQGQCIALQSGSYRALLDCGGTKDAGAVAADYFHSRGGRAIDLLVLTHYHEDHTNGVEELLSRIPVKVIAMPDIVDKNPALRENIETLAERYGTEVWYIEVQTHVPFGSGTLTLYPPLSLVGDNEMGLSILCATGDWEALVTGDMGADTEQRLIAACGLPDIELLLLGHHGSRYSTSQELLDAVTPEMAVVSVGQNSYGHPAQEILDRLKRAQITLYRTDRMGTVQVSVGH